MLIAHETNAQSVRKKREKKPARFEPQVGQYVSVCFYGWVVPAIVVKRTAASVTVQAVKVFKNDTAQEWCYKGMQSEHHCVTDIPDTQYVPTTFRLDKFGSWSKKWCGILKDDIEYSRISD